MVWSCAVKTKDWHGIRWQRLKQVCNMSKLILSVRKDGSSHQVSRKPCGIPLTLVIPGSRSHFLSIAFGMACILSPLTPASLSVVRLQKGGYIRHSMVEQTGKPVTSPVIRCLVWQDSPIQMELHGSLDMDLTSKSCRIVICYLWLLIFKAHHHLVKMIRWPIRFLHRMLICFSGCSRLVGR